MKIVILTPFFWPNINGMTLSCHRHAEIISSENPGCKINFLYINGLRFTTYSFTDLPFNFKLQNKSWRNAVKVLESADVIILEGWSHILLFVFSLCMNKKRILFSHGSHFPTNYKLFSILKFVMRQLLFCVPNILILFSRVRFITLSSNPDYMRFRDVLLFKLLKRRFFVIPNTSFCDNVKNNIIDSDVFNNKYFMVGVGDDNKGQLEIVKYWISIDKFGELHLYFPVKNHYTSEIESLICNNEIKNVQVYYGLSRQQIWSVTQSYKALIVNSKTECQSLVVIDALANNVKVVSTRVGQYFDEYDRHFFYFDRGKRESFLNALSNAENSSEVHIVGNLFSTKLYRNLFNYQDL